VLGNDVVEPTTLRPGGFDFATGTIGQGDAPAQTVSGWREIIRRLVCDGQIITVANWVDPKLAK
jgi:hypothetical protein